MIKLAGPATRRRGRGCTLIERMMAHLDAGSYIPHPTVTEDESRLAGNTVLSPTSPIMYIANLGEDRDGGHRVKQVAEHAARNGATYISITGKLEEEISELAAEEKKEYLMSMGLEESGLDTADHGRLRHARSHHLLYGRHGTPGLDGEERHPAQKAAGKIHTDFERGFIRAEVFDFRDLVRPVRNTGSGKRGSSGQRERNT